MFGSPEVTTGGRALKFYSSMRIDVRRIETIKQGDKMLGNRTRAKVVKNKVAPPFKQAEFDIMYGKGISREGDIMDCAVSEGIIEKAGSWFSFDGDRIGQGRENVKVFLADHPEMLNKIEGMLLDTIRKDDEKSDDDKPDDKAAATDKGKDINDDARLTVDEDGVIVEK